MAREGGGENETLRRGGPCFMIFNTSCDPLFLSEISDEVTLMGLKIFIFQLKLLEPKVLSPLKPVGIRSSIELAHEGLLDPKALW